MSDSRTYVRDNFLRISSETGGPYCCVAPYLTTYRVHTKQRWKEKRLIDIFKLEFHSRSDAYWYDAIRNGLVRINNLVCEPETVVVDGDVISHTCCNVEYLSKGDQVEVLYEDDDILAVTKPAGIPCYPHGRYRKLSLTRILKSFHFQDEDAYLHLINRLDRVTSGVVLLAKHKAAARHYSGCIRNATKVYIAKVKGKFPSVAEFFGNSTTPARLEEPDVVEGKRLSEGENRFPKSNESYGETALHSEGSPEDGLSNPAGEHRDTKFSRSRNWLIVEASLAVMKNCHRQPLTVMANSKDGKLAETWFQPLCYDGTHSLLLVKPISGRTHQIRVHLRLLGYPIVNDKLYGFSEDSELQQSDSPFVDSPNKPDENYEEVLVSFDIEPSSLVSASKKTLNITGKIIDSGMTLEVPDLNTENSDDVSFDKERELAVIRYQVEDPVEICLTSYHYELPLLPLDASRNKSDACEPNDYKEPVGRDDLSGSEPLQKRIKHISTHRRSFTCRSLPGWATQMGPHTLLESIESILKDF